MKQLDATEALTLVNKRYYQLLRTEIGKWRVVTHPDFQTKLKRTGRLLNVDPSQLIWFLTQSVDWLPKDGDALLWIDSQEVSYPSMSPILWKLLDCHADDSPFGVHFPKFGFDIVDAIEAANSDASHNVEELISILVLIAVSEWPARLIACDQPEFIEFWEGNIFFYSTDTKRVAEADELLVRYGITPDPL